MSAYQRLFTFSRKINFCTLPVEVFGNSLKMMLLGVLNLAICSLQKLITSCSVALRPRFKETKAQGVSPHFSSCLATTAASKISGC